MDLRHLLLTLLLLPTTLWAWGPEGHRAVGLLAKDHLTPAAHATIATLLAGEDLGEERVTSWADYVRGNKRMAKVYPENGRWHYIDAPVDLSPDAFSLTEDGHDVVSQVMRWQQELANAAASPSTRRDAVRFLAHLVGDLHQPLHCTDREGDRGGNLVPVNSFRGRYFAITLETASNGLPNLHRTWDHYLVTESMAGAGLTSWVERLQGSITPEQVEAWSAGAPKDWAWATHEQAVAHAYRLADGTEMPRPGSGLAVNLDTTNYIDAGAAVVEMQIKMAGVRLAHLINQALQVRPATEPSSP